MDGNLNLVFIGVITLLPVLGVFFLWRSQDKEKEPFRAMFTCFLFGMLSIIPFLIINLFYGDLFQQNASRSGVIFGLAFAEEVMKAIMLIAAIEVTQRWFSQIVDGLIYGSALALGFAFAENIAYLSAFPSFDTIFVIVYLMRSLNTIVAHSLFTGLFGFFYASAYLRHEIFHPKKHAKPWQYWWKHIWECVPFHVTFTHILPNRPSTVGHPPGSLIVEGILLVSLLHGFFNMLLQRDIYGYQLSFLTFPLIFGLSYLVWRMFLQKIYIKIVHRVSGR